MGLKTEYRFECRAFWVNWSKGNLVEKVLDNGLCTQQEKRPKPYKQKFTIKFKDHGIKKGLWEINLFNLDASLYIANVVVNSGDIKLVLSIILQDTCHKNRPQVHVADSLV